MTSKHAAILLTAVLGLASVGRAADDLYVYPAKGQSPDKQAKDQQECHDWAVQQTGVDPVKLAEQTSDKPAAGSAAKGMAGGAAFGAVRGLSEGESGEGAARGAGIGRVIAMARARRQMQEEHEADMQKHQQREAQLGKYDRAYTACLTGRGYTVN